MALHKCWRSQMIPKLEGYKFHPVEGKSLGIFPPPCVYDKAPELWFRILREIFGFSTFHIWLDFESNTERFLENSSFIKALDVGVPCDEMVIMFGKDCCTLDFDVIQKRIEEALEICGRRSRLRNSFKYGYFDEPRLDKCCNPEILERLHTLLNDLGLKLVLGNNKEYAKYAHVSDEITYSSYHIPYDPKPFTAVTDDQMNPSDEAYSADQSEMWRWISQHYPPLNRVWMHAGYAEVFPDYEWLNAVVAPVYDATQDPVEYERLFRTANELHVKEVNLYAWEVAARATRIRTTGNTRTLDRIDYQNWIDHLSRLYEVSPGDYESGFPCSELLPVILRFVDAAVKTGWLGKGSPGLGSYETIWYKCIHKDCNLCNPDNPNDWILVP